MHTAIITGGTRGIGRAIAAAIVKDGGRVMIAGVDTARVAEAVRGLGTSAGDRVAGQVADVRDRAAADALIDATVRRFGGFDVLVNNAAVGLFSPVESTSDDDWRSVIETNLSGPFLCT